MTTPQQVQLLLNQVKEKKDLERAEAKHKETNDKLDSLNESIKNLGLKENISDILDEIKNIKVEVPTVEVNSPDIIIPEIKVPDINVEVPEIKIPEIKVPEVKVNVEAPIVNVNNPEEIKVKEPTWISKIFTPIVEAIKNKVIPPVVFPKNANEAIPVRLSNGKKFYEILSNIGTQIGGAVDTSDLATEAKQDNIITAIENIEIDTSDLATADNQTNGSQKTQILDLYNVNNIKTVGLVTYIGMEDKDGVYCIKKIDSTTDDVFTYATITNNPTITTYANAWAGILTNTYSIYSLAF
jgi:hypothetical protein